MNISAKALRTRVREILEHVDRGESVTVTYRGKPRARLVGLEDERPSGKRDSKSPPAFGMWSDRDDLDDVDGHVRSLRRGRFDADRY